MSYARDIQIPGRPLISAALRKVVRASLDQPRPSKQLVRALNQLLGVTGDELCTDTLEQRRNGAS